MRPALSIPELGLEVSIQVYKPQWKVVHLELSARPRVMTGPLHPLHPAARLSCLWHGCGGRELPVVAPAWLREPSGGSGAPGAQVIRGPLCSWPSHCRPPRCAQALASPWSVLSPERGAKPVTSFVKNLSALSDWYSVYTSAIAFTVSPWGQGRSVRPAGASTVSELSLGTRRLSCSGCAVGPLIPSPELSQGPGLGGGLPPPPRADNP